MIRRSLGPSRVLIMLAGVALFLGGFGQPAHAQSRQETLIIARNIDDYVTNDVHRHIRVHLPDPRPAAYDTLVTVDAPDFTKIQPRLATVGRCPRTAPSTRSSSGPGVKFTSGNPVTAHDVRFSLRRLKNLKDNPAFFLDPVKDIEVVDDRTVRRSCSRRRTPRSWPRWPRARAASPTRRW